ncbi:hypothetical protein BOX15_Mlig028771g3 [Macrostomum lignano]|uniref:Proline-rich protein 5 n=2 Tax=Macrostomum lignano TaxID=282301 RepID=A0A1I8HDY9_9PLAT|nr:hypothetical protein BOX15_Mlig028771g3 [Macrostomum lignano]
MGETLKPQQQQTTLRHSLTVPTGFQAYQKRYSTPNPRLQATTEEVPVPLMKAVSSVPHEGLSARNPVWMEVQTALIDAFKGRSNPNLGHTARLVRLLSKTVSTGLVFDYLEKSLLKKGFKIICRRLDCSSQDPEELLESMEAAWRFFHDQVVTEVKCILQPMGLDLQLLERALMLGFRDQVLLPTGLHGILRSEVACSPVCSLSPGLTRMLLVLQMHRDSEPPSENDVALERIVALTVRPYIGFLGVYNGTEEPERRANLPELVRTRRRLTRRAFVSRSSVFRRAGGGSSDSSSAPTEAAALASAAAVSNGAVGPEAEGITIVLTDECCIDGDDDDGDGDDQESADEADDDAETTPSLEVTAEESEEHKDKGTADEAALSRERYQSDHCAESAGATVIFV